MKRCCHLILTLKPSTLWRPLDHFVRQGQKQGDQPRGGDVSLMRAQALDKLYSDRSYSPFPVGCPITTIESNFLHAYLLCNNYIKEKTLWEANLAGSQLSLTATPTEMTSYLEEDKASVFTVLGLTWAKPIHQAQTLGQKQKSWHLRRTRRERLKCWGWREKEEKNQDIRERLGELKIKRKRHFFTISVH